MNNLWFVKYEHKTECQQIVFNFTLASNGTEQDAFKHGRTMISADYAESFRDAEAAIICRTADTVLCFEPC